MRDSNVTIAVVAPQEPFEFFEMFWEGAWSAAHELAPLGVKVLTLSTLGLDGDEQATVLRELLAEDVQAIVLLPGDSKRLDPLIEQHTLRNTPVVTVFNDAPASRRSAFVGSDFRLSGRLAGDLMSKMVKPKSHIVALTGQRDSLYLRERYEGFRDALQASKVPLGLTTLDDPDHFAAVVAGRANKFDGLYIGCSETTNIRTILEQVRPSARCVTFDLTELVKPFLEKGIVSAVIDSSRYYQGYIAVQKAFECLQTPSMATTWVPIPSSVVLPEHVTAAGERSSLNAIFETLVRQRTLQLRNYKQALDAANTRLMRLAETDPLTGLLNRRKFEEILAIVGVQASERSPVSLAVIDLEEFTALNNLLGNTAGDQVLSMIAETLRSLGQPNSSIARIGPDEFAICLPGFDGEAARAWSAQMEAAIQEIQLPAHPEIRLGVGIGIATASSAIPGIQQAFGQAERFAKKSKSNCKQPDALSEGREWIKVRLLF